MNELDRFVCAAQEVWWLILTVLGIFVWVVSTALKTHTLLKRIDYHDKRIKEEREDIAMLLKSSFATLDGLKQLGANGKTNTMYDEMRKYVLERH